MLCSKNNRILGWDLNIDSYFFQEAGIIIEREIEGEREREREREREKWGGGGGIKLTFE